MKKIFTNIRSLNVRNFNIAMLKYMYKLEERTGTWVQTFDLQAPYQPNGDQPQAIAELVEGVKAGKRHQTLLGATGTGKTFTISNVIQQVKKTNTNYGTQ